MDTIPLFSHKAPEKQKRLTAWLDYPLSGTRVYREQTTELCN